MQSEGYTPGHEIEEGYCPKREDETHCDHWWDGGPCCNCDAHAQSDEEIMEQTGDPGTVEYVHQMIKDHEQRKRKRNDASPEIRRPCHSKLRKETQ